MIDFTLLDKIKAIFSLIFSSPLFLILLFGMILMLVDIYYISKKNKSTKIVYTIISIIVIFFLLQNYFDSFLDIMNTVAKGVVSLIYFPTVLEYIIMLLISLIIILVGSCLPNINKKIKIINSFVFAINVYLFFLIIDQISNNNIDLSDKVSIYTNDSLMILFEISIAIFFLWIIGLILYKIIKLLINKNTKIEEIELPRLKDEYLIKQDIQKEEMFTLEEYKQMKEFLKQSNYTKKD